MCCSEFGVVRFYGKTYALVLVLLATLGACARCAAGLLSRPPARSFVQSLAIAARDRIDVRACSWAVFRSPVIEPLAVVVVVADASCDANAQYIRFSPIQKPIDGF